MNRMECWLVVCAFVLPWAACTGLASSDKTLVAWASPANLKQGGGSILTIEKEHQFDAIVLGEKMKGRWMAGSDRYARTQGDQRESPAETVGPDSLVQIAIVYRDDAIELYRDGERYAHYTTKNINLLEQDKHLAVFGLRHLEASTGQLFAGTIEDARVYAQALTREEIRSLKPNVAAAIQPLAWWDFEGVSAKDRMGHFTHHVMVGGAGLKAGKLWLDGSGYLVAARAKGDLCLLSGTQPSTTAIPLPIRGMPAYDPIVMPTNPPCTWLTYHLAHPGPSGAMPGDPNPAFFYKGRYHLHYIYNNKDGFAFAHVSSTDMVHWVWHPTTLSPATTGHGMFSGTGFFTKNGTPAMIYHGQGSGKNVVAFGLDDQLEDWSVPLPVEPLTETGTPAAIRHWDPDCWLMNNTYYALSGGANPQLMKSADLKFWKHRGDLFHADFSPGLGVAKAEDVSCANMFKLGDKWMLLCISHALGARYYLGDFKNEQYLPTHHALLNWARWDCFAPESFLTSDGRRVMTAWCTPAANGMQRTRRKSFDGLLKKGVLQQGIQCLPRELTLPSDGILRIKPIRELEVLRQDMKEMHAFTIKSDTLEMMQGVAGDTLELEVRIAPSTAAAYGLNLLCDEHGANGFTISTGVGSTTLNVGYVAPPFELKGEEELTLRIFIDKSMIEVFANDRQAVVAWHEYRPEDRFVSLFSKGGDTTVKSLKAWKVKSIYP